MHPLQEKIIVVSKKHNLSRLSLRELGALVGEKHPQKIKHHLNQLYQKGFLTSKRDLNIVDSIKLAKRVQPKVVKVPVVGCANCGTPCVLANEKIAGYLAISPELLAKRDGIFAVKAEGDSMNMANINGNNIDDGDYVIVDFRDVSPKDGEYVLSIIDDCANIKKFVKDTENHQIQLVSESTQNYPPIIISLSDNFMVNGKVIQVVKRR